MRASFLAAIALFGCVSIAEAQWQQCHLLKRHGKLSDAASCFTRLTSANDPLSRAEGYFGLQRYDEANNEFRDAEKFQPRSAVVKTEWGRLFADHAQPGDAAKLFEEAIEADPNYAPAYLNLARVLAQSFDKKAVELTEEALQHDPKMVEAYEFLAYLALEDGDQDLATKQAQKALAMSDSALDAMAVLASMDWLNGKSESPWMQRILALNPAYGEAYATAAHFLVINYRNEDAIAFYRKAIALNPELWRARSQLGVNLLRLGSNEEAKQQLVRCYEAHFRDAETLNALRFLDRVGDFELRKSGQAEILLDKKEANLLAPYIEPELKRAMAFYAHKYQMMLPGTVRLELYPNSADFQVRTIGLPAQVGLLGVTFGTVVAMESPSAAAPGDFNWVETMWHELSHVYVVTGTHNLVPRWFTEGLAVHEEHAQSPGWGNRLTPDIIEALRSKKLLSVLDLDRGFVRPQFRGQVLVSYYQAGKICDFISEKWGDAAIVGMIKSYAGRRSTAEAIQTNLHQSPEAFDKAFSEWLQAKTGNAVQHFDEWKASVKEAHADLDSGKTQDAIAKSSMAIDYYPEYLGAGNAYQLLSAAYEKAGNMPGAAETLERYRDLGGHDVETLKKLAQAEQKLGHKEQMRTTLANLETVYPQDEYVHRTLGALFLEGGQSDVAIREYRAVLALRPADVATSHFDLAKALSAAHRNGEAKDEVLLALEAAPNYKPAQHLLLQLSQ